MLIITVLLVFSQLIPFTLAEQTRLTPAVVSINTVDELNKLKAENENLVIGVFKHLTSHAAISFQNTAQKIETVKFAYSSEIELFEVLNVKASRGIIMFIKSDKYANVFEGVFDKEEIKQFVHSNLSPIVFEYTQEVSVFFICCCFNKTLFIQIHFLYFFHFLNRPLKNYLTWKSKYIRCYLLAKEAIFSKTL